MFLIYEILKRLYHKQDRDEASDAAAHLAYYFLFALFPFLFFLTTLAAYLPLGGALKRGISQVQFLLPSAAQKLVHEHLEVLLLMPRPQLMTLGLLVAVWSASRGVNALRRALNLAYNVKESRSYWHIQALSIAFTLGGGVLVLTAVALLLLGGKAGYWFAALFHLDAVYVQIVSALRWPVTVTFIALTLGAIFYFLPDKKQKFRHVVAGSLLTTLGWSLSGLGLGLYVSTFNGYNVAYESIAGVMVILTWLYILGFVLLIGGEMNEILARGTFRPQDTGADPA